MAPTSSNTASPLRLLLLLPLLACVATAGRAAEPLHDDGGDGWQNRTQCDLQGVPRGERCWFVSSIADCLSSSRVDYLQLPYCRLSAAALPGGLVVLVLWLGFLFINLALVVDFRVVPNLETVSKALHMSNTLAGVTLLAFGNGAADIFSAAAAVSASESGGLLAVSGLLGGGLFVTTVVVGLISIVHSPAAQFGSLARDVFFYAVSLAWITYIVSDGKVTLLEGGLFLGQYVVYVLVVVLGERFFGDRGASEASGASALPTEKMALLGSHRGESSTDPAPGPTSAQHTVASTDLDRGTSSKAPRDVEAGTGAGAAEGAGPSWPADASLRHHFDLLCKGEQAFAARPLWKKGLLVLQIPVRFGLVLTAAVVHHRDPSGTWCRLLRCINLALSIPLAVLIVGGDTFYGDEIQGGTIPVALSASGLSILTACAVYFLTTDAHQPAWNSLFAAQGFLIALLFIYMITDEIVSVLRAFGVILGVSEATVGLTVLGIGNGTCDLIANFLVAQSGFPDMAISAAYGGPVLNTFIGFGIAAMVGIASGEGSSYAVAFDNQLIVGLSFLAAALAGVLLLVLLAGQQFSRGIGIALLVGYTGFVVTSITVEATT